MPTIYIAPGVGRGTGNGPGDNQARADFKGINWQAGLEVLVRRGTRLHLPAIGGRAGLFIPTRDGLRISHYGDAERPPILHGSINYANGWTNEGRGLFSRTGPGQSGVVLLRDEPLPFFDNRVAGATDALANSNNGGYMISTGDSNPKITIKLPGGANPNNGGVAISATMIGIECTNNTKVSDLDIDGIELLGFSRQGMNLRNLVNSKIRNNFVHATGGDRTNAWYVGGCIQCTGGCNGIEFTHNHVYDCWDSPFSPQIPAGNNGASIQNITYRENLVSGGWALAGIEMASWVTNGLFRNILVENNRIMGGGSGYAGKGDGPRGPLGIIINANRGPSPSNRFENIVIRNNSIVDCASGGIFVEHANITNSKIESNSIINCGFAGPRGRAGNGNAQSRGGIDIETGELLNQDVTVASNEISRCKPHGIAFNSNRATSAGPFINNTLVDNGTWNITVKSNARLPVVRNNICYGAGIHKAGTAGFQANFNNVSQAAKAFDGFTKGAQSSIAGPGLVNPAQGDYQLRANSPCIDAGNNVHTVDRLGRAFTTRDLGCYANKPAVECVDLEALTDAPA